MTRWFLLCLLALAPAWGRAQDLPTYDWDASADVRSVQLYRGESELGYPVLYLSRPEQHLTLAFDLMGAPRSDLQFRLVHCDANWEVSRLMPIEYFNGFPNDRILTYQGARQTKVNYTHYTAVVPGTSQGGWFKVSGNYLLVVHPQGEEDHPLFVRRLLVAEDAIGIAPESGLALSVTDRFKLQRVAFSLVPTAVSITDAYRELKVVVLQNFRWDNAARDMRPSFLMPGKIEYSLEPGNQFPGGNEFRVVDMRSLNQNGMQVQQVDRNANPSRVLLYPDQPRNRMGYLANPDFNGLFYTGLTPLDRYLGALEGDYVRTHFRLQAYPLPRNQEIYLLGAFTRWQCLPEYRLEWSADEQAYVVEPLLKQGIYNYLYVVRDADAEPGTPPDETRFEGSFFETDNTYTILVYYRRFGDRFDRLLGLRFLNYYEGR